MVDREVRVPALDLSGLILEARPIAGRTAAFLRAARAEWEEMARHGHQQAGI